MHDGIVIAGMLAGGLGLFMLAVSMITEGLKAAAGLSLHNLLARWTRSPAHGVFTGLTITAIVQSSSAVTVATIGFVNAGLISMRQALGIVYGSNIGTTMTGWLVAIVGFKVNIEAFALPIIGLGMLLRLTGGEKRRASIGLALAGFGLFFIGIDVLKNAFDGLLLSVELGTLTVGGVREILLFLAAGFLITLLTQSSSAAIAITLTAATGNVIGLYAAAAMVVGANLGTTSTAAIAVIGATPNAKRVACAHILFNGATGIIALLILPVLFWVVESASSALGLDTAPAVTLALFHTVFNILGVLLIFPVNNRLADFLEKRFVTQEEKEAQPKYLDKNVLVSPELALHALSLELTRVAAISRRMALAALSHERARNEAISHDHAVILRLSHRVFEFIARLERKALSEEVSADLSRMLRGTQHLMASAEQSMETIRSEAPSSAPSDEVLIASAASFRARVANLVDAADLTRADFSTETLRQQQDEMETAYEDVKASLLLAGAQQRLPINDMMTIVDQNSHIRRMARQLTKAIHLLGGVQPTVELPDTAGEEAQQNPTEIMETQGQS
ncbi:MAG: hypothetical protein Hals2KO_19620 [Halioglobus sp.]